MSSIVLSTLNARYHHASFGLRYLAANLGELQNKTTLKEYTLKTPVDTVVNEILSLSPKIVGFGIYIWNTEQTIPIIKKIKSLRPEIIIVVGGPEVSFEIEKQDYFWIADYIFKGEADFTFRDFCNEYLINGKLPANKLIAGPIPEINDITSPYSLYTDDDIKNRTIYVEASRGCPYKCEYCLSSLDKSVRNFEITKFLADMSMLIDRGVRQFKFVDRTFNLSPTISLKILNFFLEKIDLGLFLHFEMVPDRLPNELKEIIKKFPKGSLQFEIGIQTFNPVVGKNVSRRQDIEKIKTNFKFLREQTHVHTHADLIVGLPGENLESFALGFDELSALHPDEVQVGILKRLKGSPLARHEHTFKMIYSEKPPFQIISTADMTAIEITQMERFASFWDKIANSGKWPNFYRAFKLKNENESLFYRFFNLSDYLWNCFNRTHSISMEELSLALRNYAVKDMNCTQEIANHLVFDDLKNIGFMYFPEFLNVDKKHIKSTQVIPNSIPKRQILHNLNTHSD